MLSIHHLAVIGSGFSGTLLAINLLRFGIGQVTLIERAGARLGRGCAYGEAGAEHVLNVRAGNMSAFPDQPEHFAHWLDETGLGGAKSFATRRTYGAYLAGLLDAARASAGQRLHVRIGDVTALRTDESGATLTFSSGETLRVDGAVLAPGNLPPHDLPAVSALSRPDYIDDPWSADLADNLDPERIVLLLGSGLTAVDCALTLASGGFAGQILMLSRRGLAPHSHADQPPFTRRSEMLPHPASVLVRMVRNRAVQIGWRNAVDELRPFTQHLWRSADAQTRGRFLRHLRPYWDVHRHRLAPAVAEQIAGLRASGRIDLRAGRLLRVETGEGGMRAVVRPRGAPHEEAIPVQRIINCTGPLGDLSRTHDPLLVHLRDTGLIRADALSIGIDVDQQARAIAASGRPDARLFVVGPMTRGAQWEIVAVPDIRRQLWDLSRYLTNNHWQGAEGL